MVRSYPYRKIAIDDGLQICKIAYTNRLAPNAITSEPSSYFKGFTQDGGKAIRSRHDVNSPQSLIMLSTLILPLFALSAVSASPFTAHSIAARSIAAHTAAARSIAASSTTPVAAAWYAGWHATEGFPLSSISWEKYNTLYYSFA
jgi:hypothetical protein